MIKFDFLVYRIQDLPVSVDQAAFSRWVTSTKYYVTHLVIRPSDWMPLATWRTLVTFLSGKKLVMCFLFLIFCHCSRELLLESLIFWPGHVTYWQEMAKHNTSLLTRRTARLPPVLHVWRNDRIILITWRFTFNQTVTWRTDRALPELQEHFSRDTFFSILLGHVTCWHGTRGHVTCKRYSHIMYSLPSHPRLLCIII